MIVHFHQGGDTLACGQPRRQQGHVSFSAHKIAVTCPDCMATLNFKAARQRIPEVQGGPYRG